ncbi:hypothetical protein BC835DRAFT_329691 [Cytidiella melzeri]|nr:hypothetical protein BC835DRAFT_329691 [Cytidiella melzeri]
MSLRLTAHPYAFNGMGLLCSAYYRTAATLYGFFNTSLPAFPSAVSYSVSLDGVSTTNYASSFTTDPDSQDNILAAFTNLTNGEHFLELALHSSGNVSEEIILLMFDRVVLVHSALPASTDPCSPIKHFPSTQAQT